MAHDPADHRGAARLAALEIRLVGVMVAASVVSPRTLPFAVAVAAILLAQPLPVAQRAVHRPHGRRLVHRPVAALLPVALWATALPEVTRPQVYRFLIGLAVYDAVVNWAASFVRLRIIAAGVVAAGLLLALSAPVTVQWMAEGKLTFIPEAIYRRLPLLLSDPIHPDVMAGALALALPCALALPLFRVAVAAPVGTRFDGGRNAGYVGGPGPHEVARRVDGDGRITGAACGFALASRVAGRAPCGGGGRPGGLAHRPWHSGGRA